MILNPLETTVGLVTGSIQKFSALNFNFGLLCLELLKKKSRDAAIKFNLLLESDVGLHISKKFNWFNINLSNSDKANKVNMMILIILLILVYKDRKQHQTQVSTLQPKQTSAILASMKYN